MTSTAPQNYTSCYTRILLIYTDVTNCHKKFDAMTINGVNVTGYSKYLLYQHSVIDILLDQKLYAMAIMLINSQFHDMDQSPLYIQIKYPSNSTLWIKNCTFNHIVHKESDFN